MILEEEYKEANYDSTGWGMGIGFSWGLTAIFGGIGVQHESSGLAVAAACSLALLAVCAIGYIRCRRVVKAWRNQKRFEMAQREVEKMGGGK